MEQIAAQPVKNQPPLKSLRELSPSVAMICDRAENDPTLWKNASICTYVNSRIFGGVKAALYRGDITAAMLLEGFLLPQGAAIQYRYRILLAFPKTMIEIGTLLLIMAKQAFKIAKRCKIG